MKKYQEIKIVADDSYFKDADIQKVKKKLKKLKTKGEHGK